jgi:serine/threonine-protein kinase HipA
MKIFVIKNSTPLGMLHEEAEGIVFTYFDSIDKSQYIIGLKNKKNVATTLFSVFENLLPEHEQLELIKAKYNIKGIIGVLLHLNNIHGSFEFYSQTDYENFKKDSFSPFHFNEVKDYVLEQDYTYPNILSDYSIDIKKSKIFPTGIQGSKVIGISGFQYKFSVSLDRTSKTIVHNENKDGLYIMKPFNKERLKFGSEGGYIPHLLVNEHIFMTLARDFGFSVPYNAIIKYEEDYLYIIKRFDRFQGKKIDHHEILTLIGGASKEKYNITALEALKTAAKYLDKDELTEMYSFFVFSIIIAHGDLHAKNISLIYKTNALEETEMTLAPYYDISTIKIYKDVSKNDIGMKVKNKPYNIKRDDLIWLANSINISSDKAEDIIDDTGLRFIKNFESYIDKLPSEIKALKIAINRYGYSKPFEATLRQYYDQRVAYLDKYLGVSLQEDTEDIWS